MCVCTALTLQDRESKWRNRFYSLLASDCEMEIYSNNEERKKKKRQEAEEQISCWTAEFANQFSQILFLYLYI